MSTIEPQDVRLRDGTTAVVRSACQEDAENLVALYREVVAEGPWTQAQEDERKFTAADEATEIDRLNGHAGSVYLVACDDSGVIGTASPDYSQIGKRSGSSLVLMVVNMQLRGVEASTTTLQGELPWHKITRWTSASPT